MNSINAQISAKESVNATIYPKGPKGDKGNEITNIVQNEDYSLTITLSDGKTFTTNSIRGATGKGIKDIKKTKSEGLIDTYTITYTDNDTDTFTVTNANMGSGYTKKEVDDLVNNVKQKSIQAMQQLETPPPETGENITLNDSKAGKFKSFDIRGNSKQEEEPSSSNEAPIKSCGDNINATVSNKNKFNLEEWFENVNKVYCTKTLIENGIKLEFEAGADAYIGFISTTIGSSLPANYKNQLLRVNDNTNYVISVENKFPKCYVAFWGKDYKLIGYRAISNINKKFNFTTPENTKYLTLRLGIQNSTFTSYTFENIQLEEGNLVSNHIKHEEQLITVPTQKTFRSIGDIRDHFIKQGGKRYEYHPIKRVILDGTESYTITNNLDNWIQFRQNVVNSIAENTELMCNYFKYADANTVYSDKLEAITVDTNNRFRISFLNNTEITTVEQFKAWLAQKYAEGHPVYIDYVLAEPELILCTEEQNAVLSDIEDHLETYDDVTHIYSTDEVAPNFEVTYCKDVEKLFNNIAI